MLNKKQENIFNNNSLFKQRKPQTFVDNIKRVLQIVISHDFFSMYMYHLNYTGIVLESINNNLDNTKRHLDDVYLRILEQRSASSSAPHDTSSHGC